MNDDFRSEPMSVAEAQAYCDQEGPYLIGFPKNPETLVGKDVGPYTNDTLKGFLHNFIWKYNRQFPTLYKGGKQQTSMARARSITDMTRIAKSYFPDSNVVQVRNALLELVKEKLIGASICYTIRRRTFYQGTASDFRDVRDEFGWKFNKPMKRQPNVQKPIVATRKVRTAPAKATPILAPKKKALPKKTMVKETPQYKKDLETLDQRKKRLAEKLLRKY